MITSKHPNPLSKLSFTGLKQKSRIGICKNSTTWENSGKSSCTRTSKPVFDVILVSSGGVGSTTLFESMERMVSKNLNSANDLDRLKHGLFYVTSNTLSHLVQAQKAETLCGTRIFVYTFGDAAASVFSLYRRKFHQKHNIKLRERPFPQNCFPANVSMYASHGIDYLGLENHFHSWFHGGLCSERVPVFFLRDEGRKIPRVWEILRDAVKYPYQQYSPDLLDLKIETSHYASDEETANDYARMKKIYSRLQDQLNSLGYLSIAFHNDYLRLV